MRILSHILQFCSNHFKGHYLKVGGKFKSCTGRSVKQFQKAKGLKMTGKVDENTAVKLGII